MALCPNCAHENPPGARFCNGCGGALEADSVGSAEERRIVTILFADMAGFTARAERLDPEDVRAILSRYYARLRGELEAFGGTVEKFIGDAVVATFGAPTAHGDDPERAVRAAFALSDAVAEMNRADPSLKLEIRVGVNTGEAIVSLSNAALNEGMVAGDVVNTASRMQSGAPTNAILVGEETYRSTRGCVEYSPVEPLNVKGKQLPVSVWRAVALKTRPGERRPSVGPMLGRINEISTLRRLFDGVVGATATALARHWREAGENERALDYLLLAADQAGRGWAKDEAAKLYGEALELCGDDPARRREIVHKRALAVAALQHVADVRQSRRAQAPSADIS